MSQVSKKWTTEQMEKAEKDVEAMRAVIRQLRAAIVVPPCRAAPYHGWGTRDAVEALKASDAYAEEAEPAEAAVDPRIAADDRYKSAALDVRDLLRVQAAETEAAIYKMIDAQRT